MFGGVPLFYTPWADFPLDGNRKSGLLVPSVSAGSDGVSLSVPYYFNLAPNFDATFAPGIIGERGATFDGQIRYLRPDYSGQTDLTWLPHDKKSGRNNRYQAKWQHRHDISDTLQAGVDFNQVSDSGYYRDFYGGEEIAGNVNLNRRVWLDYGGRAAGGSLNAAFRFRNIRRWQTKAATKTNLTPSCPAFLPIGIKTQAGRKSACPHNLPASATTAADWSCIPVSNGISATAGATSAPNSGCTPLITASTVSAAKHPAASGAFCPLSISTAAQPSNAIRACSAAESCKPSSRACSTTIFLPNLKTTCPISIRRKAASATGSFSAKTFYYGNDRINAANSLSTAVQSRILDGATGEERFRAGIGQKFYFKDDAVMLDGSVGKNPRSRSDWVAFASGGIGGRFTLDSSIHYNQNDKRAKHYAVGAGYRPAPGKVLNARYKYGRNEKIYLQADGSYFYDKLSQLDLSAQWPLTRNLSAVVRYNYGFEAKKPIEMLAGAEYKSSCGCWGAGVYAQRYVTGENTYKNAVFFSLQLKDLQQRRQKPRRQDGCRRSRLHPRPLSFRRTQQTALTVGNPAGAPFLHKIAFHRQPQTRHQRQDSNDKERMMKIKALMIAAALLAAADVHAAPQKAKTAPAKAVKAAATAQKEAAPAQQQGGIRFSDGIAAVADNEVITNRRLAEAVAEAKATLPEDAQISESELSRQVLMQLVNQSLIVQAGKRRNIQASEAEIDAVVAQNPALKPQPHPTPRACRQHHCRKSPPAGSDAKQPRERS